MQRIQLSLHRSFYYLFSFNEIFFWGNILVILDQILINWLIIQCAAKSTNKIILPLLAIAICLLLQEYRYELCFTGEKMIKATPASQTHDSETDKSLTQNSHVTNGERGSVDGESVYIDGFRWSRCKNLHPQTKMMSIGIPLPLELVEVISS